MQVHRVLNYGKELRDDHIFAFMKDFRITDTKVVIIGKDPTPQTESNGRGFDRVICLSTQRIIRNCYDEMRLLTQLGFVDQGDQLMFTEEEFRRAWDSCDLRGWTRQGKPVGSFSSNELNDFGLEKLHHSWNRRSPAN